MGTYEQVQIKLGKKANAPTRKDLHEDFPLRGFLLCPSCADPVTGSWTTGRVSKHPYYRCKTKGCQLSGKSLRRDEVEQEFEKLLIRMRPRPEVLELTKEILMETWHVKKKCPYRPSDRG